MSLNDLYDILSSGSVPVFYDHAPNGTMLPFATYTTDSSNFSADNRTYSKGFTLRLVLYVGNKSPEIEAEIEEIFDTHDIPWDREEIYISEERLYQEIYTAVIP